ncbi:MAG: hypothetical protein ABIH23_21750 [bacterium]
MSTGRYRIRIPIIAASIGLAIIFVGAFGVKYKVFDSPPGDPNDLFAFYEMIGEPQMIVDATFGGVARTEHGVLYSTYDRTALLGGHKPCPT